jgi:hypothetical protein
MKKVIGIGIILILIVVSLSGCLQQETNNQQDERDFISVPDLHDFIADYAGKTQSR